MTLPKTDPLADLPWPKPEAPREEVSVAIRRACTRGLCAQRGPSAATRLAVCLTLSSILAGVGFWFGLRHHRSEFGMRVGVYGALGWALLQALVLFVAFSPPRERSRLGSRPLRLGLAVAIPLLFLGYLTYSAWSYVPFVEFSRGARASHAFTCGLVALTFGGLLSGGVLLAWRGTDPMTPRLSGTLAGLIGGIGGALAVSIGCPSHEAWHLWLSHGLIVLALGAMGFGLGRRLLAP
jgi:hypothetical protein